MDRRRLQTEPETPAEAPVKAPPKTLRKKAAKKKSSRKKSSSPAVVDLDIYGQVDEAVELFSSGCTILDLALGGGFPERRIINIVGDESTGKTLAAMEAFANFRQKHKNAVLRYVEVESAFDKAYAREIGIPVDAVDMTASVRTVEAWHNDLVDYIDKYGESKVPILYVVDSLDALSDDAELGRGITDGSFGMSKQKQIGELFRRLVAKMADANITLIMISQVRMNIGAVFGNKKSRSGGKSLDFYSSQIVWLENRGKLIRTVNGVKRTTGIMIRADVRKNKVGPAHREAFLPIQFFFGIDDLHAGIRFLIDMKRTDEISLTVEQANRLVTRIPKMNDETYYGQLGDVQSAVKDVWKEIEAAFAPKRKKYKL